MAEIIVKLGDQVVQSYPLTADSITIGRARDNQIVVENLSVSRNHARIRRENGRFILTDLKSANGSFLNGVKVSTAELKDNDIISIGKHKLHFRLSGDEVMAYELESREELIEPMIAADDVRDDLPASVSSSFDDWGYLLVIRGKQANVLFRMQPEETTVGRANENDIRLHDWFVSKRHAIILRDPDGFLVRDLGSWRGITLNGAPIRESRIKHGDELVFGTTVVRFHVGPEDYRVEGAILSTEIPSDVQMPEAPEGFSSGEPADYTGAAAPLAERPVQAPASADDAVIGDVEDDEYAPLTDEEMALLELEHDEAFEGGSTPQAERHSRAEWEQLEAERLMVEGAGWRKGAIESDIEDDAAFPPPDPHDHLDDSGHDHQSLDEEDAEVEAALFGGPVSQVEPGSIQEPQVIEPTGETSVSSSTSDSPATTMEVPPGVDPQEFRKWSRGLRNKSRIVRREAARKLKELTGTDYDWESDPT